MSIRNYIIVIRLAGHDVFAACTTLQRNKTKIDLSTTYIVSSLRSRFSNFLVTKISSSDHTYVHKKRERKYYVYNKLTRLTYINTRAKNDDDIYYSITTNIMLRDEYTRRRTFQSRRNPSIEYWYRYSGLIFITSGEMV